MTERLKFIADCLTELYGISELAEQYGISRKTAYKWARRFVDEGIEGLRERASVAAHVANRTPHEMEKQIVELRGEHVTWGPKKLLAVLERRGPGEELPARSTVAEILKRNGLVNERRARRRREGHPGRPQGEAKSANAIWGADFKGQFLTRDGRYCYPFTVTDLYSRYVICCDGYLSTGEKGVKESLERAFREHGMPEAIRTDNGSPFASTGIGRLTRLAVWLVKLGIVRQLIQPGKPGQNGSHERMHRTLKREATQPPQANVRSQQKRFDSFVEEFNEKRPHEAIGMKTPAELYRPSERKFPERLSEPEYPGHFEVRRVSRNGGVRFRGEWLNVGHSLIEENVGLEAVGDGIWDVHFAKLRIGRFDERDLRIVGTLATHPRCGKRGNRPPGEEATREANPGDSLPSHSATDHS